MRIKDHPIPAHDAPWKAFQERQVFVINQDSFYRKFNDRELKNAAKFEFNFDHPNAVDLEKVSDLNVLTWQLAWRVFSLLDWIFMHICCLAGNSLN